MRRILWTVAFVLFASACFVVSCETADETDNGGESAQGGSGGTAGGGNEAGTGGDAANDAAADAPDDTGGDTGEGGPGARPVIMLTGYWHPTGSMIRHFSQNPTLNPDGWMGEDWEGRGYDVISYFPDPDDGYTGDFEVDYQDTSADFWLYTDLHKPIAIMSYGAGAGPWEIEFNARNLPSWVPDDTDPQQPTPCPPDTSVAAGFVRNSTLPVDEIAARVNALDLPDIGASGAWVDWLGDPGAYLCEFMAYHNMWYQDTANGGADECLMAGFTHVSSDVSVDSATQAAEEALRVLIEALDEALSGA